MHFPTKYFSILSDIAAKLKLNITETFYFLTSAMCKL